SSILWNWIVRPLMWFTIIYLTTMGLMCLGGLILARYTRGPHALDLLGKPEEDLVAEGGQVLRTSHESRLTKVYVFLLTLALVMFYLSIPFVLWGLLIILLITVLLTFFLRRDPEMADMHNDMLRASGGGIWAVFRCLFASFSSGSFGVQMDEDE